MLIYLSDIENTRLPQKEAGPQKGFASPHFSAGSMIHSVCTLPLQPHSNSALNLCHNLAGSGIFH